MGKYKRYDDEFRASAVLMLKAAGYPDTTGAIGRVSSHLSVPESTLRGWYRGTRNPPPAKMRAEKAFDLKIALKQEITLIFDEMDNTRAEASYRDLGWVGAVLIDKLRLVQDEPTAIIKLQRAVEQGAVSPEQVRQRWPTLAEEVLVNAN